GVVPGGHGVGHAGGDRVADRLVHGVDVAAAHAVRTGAAEAHVGHLDLAGVRSDVVDAADDVGEAAAAVLVQHPARPEPGAGSDAAHADPVVKGADGAGHVRAVPVAVFRAVAGRAVLRAGRVDVQVGMVEVDAGVDD